MLKLILIRHGRCKTSEDSLYCGWTDVPLSDEGLCQAYGLAKKLADYQLSAVYCSPLRRAKDTATIIGAVHGLMPIEDDDLKELNFGQWENKSWKEIEELYPEEWRQWCDNWQNFIIPGGESARQLYERVAYKLSEIMARYNGKDAVVAVISHQGCIRAMLCDLLGLGLDAYWHFKMAPAGVAEIEIEHGFGVLTRWG